MNAVEKTLQWEQLAPRRGHEVLRQVVLTVTRPLESHVVPLVPTGHHTLLSPPALLQVLPRHRHRGALSAHHPATPRLRVQRFAERLGGPLVLVGEEEHGNDHRKVEVAQIVRRERLQLLVQVGYRPLASIKRQHNLPQGSVSTSRMM